MREIFSSVETGGENVLELRQPLAKDQFVGLVETGAAVGPLAERRIAGLRIAGRAARDTAQIVFADGVADADVHAAWIPLRVIRSRTFNATGSQ